MSQAFDAIMANREAQQTLIEQLQEADVSVPWLFSLIEEQAAKAIACDDLDFNESLALEAVGYLGVLCYINSEILERATMN